MVDNQRPRRIVRDDQAKHKSPFRDIFTLAVDYGADEDAPRLFFANMQNRTIYAASGRTAAEIVRKRADAGKADMGVLAYKGSRVRKGDVATAKNYLFPPEIDTLNRITVMFLDFAEFRSRRRANIRMADWDAALVKFLADNDLPALEGFGAVTHEAAKKHAEEQYELFSARRREKEDEKAEADYAADLEATVKLLEGGKKRPKRG